MDQRQALRREIRQRRRALTTEQQQQASTALCNCLARQPLFIRSQRIALYLPNDGEIDPRPLLQLAQHHDKTCYLPVLSPDNENFLLFVQYDQHTPLTTNRFGIPEPPADPDLAISSEQLDLVLLPLVGFDRQGNRMGMGGGFYDRTFAFKHQRADQHPYLLGLAHSCQEVTALDTAHWDVPLHGIATDRGLIVASHTGAHRDFMSNDLLYNG